jgi:hypothetical protein
MKMSITRALAELKLLDKKIEDKIAKLVVATGYVPNEAALHGDALVKDEQAKLAQVTGLISRRKTLKDAIVASNASTVIEVGGVKMTVAAAIERKTSISLDKKLENRLRTAFYTVKAKVDQHNDQVKIKADQQATAVLGAQSTKDKGEEYTSVVKAYADRNSGKVYSLPDVEKLIESLQESIDNFESEVDFILSESNTRTEIDV